MQQVLQRAGGVLLRDVLPQSRFFGGNDVRVSSCCGDWRSCQPGDLYVALTGADDDGHDHAQEAVRRGAVAVLAERLLPVGVPTCIVEDTREAYGRVCQQLAGMPAEQMRVIGVTGTNGKTVTSSLIAAVLSAARQRVGWMTSLEYTDSVEMAAPYSETPAPPELATWLANMSSQGCQSAVLEISSQALATRTLAGVRLDAAVLTNLRRDHLELHGSVHNYRQAQKRLLDHFKPHGFVVINADDRASAELLSELKRPAITVAMEAPAELTATLVERHKSEQTFLLTAGNETFPVRTAIIGDHHVYNCLSAAAVGLVLGLDLATIVTGLESVQRLPCRMERIECGQPFGLFVDCADTPDRLAAALRACRQVTRGKLICVYSANPNRDPSERPLLGRTVEHAASFGIVTSYPGQFEDPLPIAQEVLDGYAKPGRACISPNRQRAIQWALEQAEPGDTVLIAGSVPGIDRPAPPTSPAGGRQVDDRAVVRQWLREHFRAESWTKNWRNAA